MTTEKQFKIDPATRLEGRKISPGGVITLPFVARLALSFVKRKAARIDVHVDATGVKLTPSQGPNPASVRSSPRGLLALPRDAQQALTAKGSRRYRLAVNAQAHVVHLYPASN